MTKLGCVRTSDLIGRRSAGLSAADALRLEEHLAGCVDCSREAALLDGMRALAQSVPATLPPVAREQAIRRAFAAADALPEASPGLQRLWPAVAFTTAALVAAAAVIVWMPRDWLGAGEAPVAKHAASVSGDRVLAGAVQVASGAQLGSDAALGTESVLRATAGARVALAHAQVELRPGTALRWSRATRELRLESGSIVADVDPRARQSFTVRTARFSVLVLGTRFEVMPDAVYVERGHVRVLAPDGTVLAQSLAAGERLAVPSELGKPAASPAAVQAEEPAKEFEPEAPAGATTASTKRTRPAGTTTDSAALLREARAELAEQHVAGARKALEAALAVARSDAERAEAMSLRAECALVAGDLGAAVEAYLRVARAYASRPAGENALFAAARLEAERGRSAAAAALLERYLARYPGGSFVKEAKLRLHELGSVLDHQP